MFGALLPAALFAASFACISPQKPAGVGGPCQQVTDCQLGFVCDFGGGPNGTNVCSSDLSHLVRSEDAGAVADAAAEGDVAPDDAMTQDATLAVDAGAVDAGPPETEGGGVPEAAPPIDSGTPDVGREAAPQPQDSGLPDAPAG